ncbi:MAG: Lrp/AsnC ligand binding domain-containing protein [Candidatus Bathyarchaeia archaeon]|jgi:DNA-binding Lrp family transcriptional regulator
MVRAYMFLNVAPSSESKVLQQLKILQSVEEAYVAYGVYDIVIRVKAKTPEELKEVVSHQIRGTDGVVSTLTLMMTEE